MAQDALQAVRHSHTPVLTGIGTLSPSHNSLDSVVEVAVAAMRGAGKSTMRREAAVAGGGGGRALPSSVSCRGGWIIENPSFTTTRSGIAGRAHGGDRAKGGFLLTGRNPTREKK